jgi:hypothetical protein
MDNFMKILDDIMEKERIMVDACYKYIKQMYCVAGFMAGFALGILLFNIILTVL